ncbi:hypothetical protein J7E79_22475 [Bacillus sp. ISL-40]|uniref:hypothetical protein n=1 Tax=unclassified Bacillus (in: firmicutes) TaxID=185979 RepID=UPI001BE6563C|nr:MULTISPECIES: hypothetical protein [unclassified Bacillus (in: firmicutes)]MBT2700136.1 hypothetical protein [Bacillus sp. ISL-40]MBT2720010.1 hypothetical protein [Bacillus sp. ISL-46]MBT2744666.1 hypothetical protein [Bacillus sp. ISL-77]
MSNIYKKVDITTVASSGMGEAANRRKERLKKLLEEIQKNGIEAIFNLMEEASHGQKEKIS